MSRLICVAILPIIFAMLSPAWGAAPSPAREQAARAFVGNLAAGRYDACVATFGAQLAGALDAGKLAAAWRQATAGMGAFAGVTAVEGGADGATAVATCRFGQQSIDVRLAFGADGRLSGLWFAPGYQPPAYVQAGSFTEEAVTVGAAGWPLPGTLSMPRGAGPFPAVVLVHGSGPNDRDETLGPNKPFRDLAQGLASRGIAVLRYDKRTLTHRAKVMAVNGLTVAQETVDDAAAAVARLQATPRVDGRKVFVLGHSLGGTMLPRVAAKAPTVAGLIMLAAATRPLEDLMLEQVRYLAGLEGGISAQEQAQLEAVGQAAAAIKSPALSAASPPVLGVPASYWLDLRSYDPVAAAGRLSQPLLVLQGGRDYQVRPADLAGWQRCAAARKGVQIKQYPALNHLFFAGTGPSTPQEYLQPHPVAAEVIEDVAAWIKGR